MQDYLIDHENDFKKQTKEFKEKQDKRSESFKGGTKNGLKQHIKEENANGR